jgi:hypothetical protein
VLVIRIRIKKCSKKIVDEYPRHRGKEQVIKKKKKEREREGRVEIITKKRRMVGR